jgi:AAA15 family ATPase/GTPase
MIADSSTRKNDNTFFPIDEGNKLRLLDSAAIYGANASGKSNILKALYIAVLNKMMYTPLATDAHGGLCPMPYARESTSSY